MEDKYKTRFKKGMTPWNKGKRMSKEQLDVMRIKVYNKRRGKTYEEIYGLDKSKNISEKQRLAIIPRLRELNALKLAKPLSQETRNKISLGNKGKVLSIETRTKISDKLIGHKHSLETINKIKSKVFGRRDSEETRLKKSYRMKRDYILGIRIPAMKGRRLSDEAKEKISKRMSLENHPNWLGGKSYEPYSKEFNYDFKSMIKLREGLMCAKCSMREEDHKQLFNLGLAVHHIDYNKKNSTPENCICLCNRCHSEANTNRIQWINFYRSILNERYGYKYEEFIKIGGINGLD